jgi:hypothetical protein
MITSKDRSGWFGASDVDKIVGNWNTKTWMDWWLVKMGVARNNIETIAMNAGTHKEHQILEYVSPFMETDKQILIEDLRLRINLDGNLQEHIYEVKTHSAEKVFKPSKKYIQQVNVQMYGVKYLKAYKLEPMADIVSYALTEDDYKNYFLPIDPERLKLHPIAYDDWWVDTTFLPRIEYLADCLIKGILPDRERKWK